MSFWPVIIWSCSRLSWREEEAAEGVRGGWREGWRAGESRLDQDVTTGRWCAGQVSKGKIRKHSLTVAWAKGGVDEVAKIPDSLEEKPGCACQIVLLESGWRHLNHGPLLSPQKHYQGTPAHGEAAHPVVDQIPKSWCLGRNEGRKVGEILLCFFLL